MLKHWVDQKEFKDVGFKGEEHVTCIRELVVKYFPKVMKVKNTVCKELVKSSELATVRNFTLLYDSIWGNLKKSKEEDVGSFMMYIEKLFVFSLIWSVGATL